MSIAKSTHSIAFKASFYTYSFYLLSLGPSASLDFRLLSIIYSWFIR